MSLPKKRWIGKKETKRSESPLFRFTKTGLLAGNNYIVNLKKTPFHKYLPLNFLQVANNTNQTLILMTDTMTTTIPSGVIRSFDSETLPAYRSINVANQSGSDATGDIEILAQKVHSYKDVIKDRL